MRARLSGESRRYELNDFKSALDTSESSSAHWQMALAIERACQLGLAGCFVRLPVCTALRARVSAWSGGALRAGSLVGTIRIRCTQTNASLAEG